MSLVGLPPVPPRAGSGRGSGSRITGLSCSWRLAITRSSNPPRGRGPDSSATFRLPLKTDPAVGASVTHPTPRISLVAAIALVALSRPAETQSDPEHHGSIVIVTGQLGTVPIPTLME